MYPFRGKFLKQLVFEILGHYNQSIVRNIAANSLKSLSVIKVSFHTKTFHKMFKARNWNTLSMFLSRTIKALN